MAERLRSLLKTSVDLLGQPRLPERAPELPPPTPHSHYLEWMHDQQARAMQAIRAMTLKTATKAH